MQSARIINSENFKDFREDELALVHGKVSSSQKIFENGFVAYQVEEKVKERDRSIWKTTESHVPNLLVSIDSNLEVILKLDEGYVLCGGFVQIQKILDKDPKKHRILGLPPNVQVTAYGKVVSLNPLIVHAGQSLCAETIVEYRASLGKKGYAYTIAILFLAIPSLFLIYLGLFRAQG